LAWYGKLGDLRKGDRRLAISGALLTVAIPDLERAVKINPEDEEAQRLLVEIRRAIY